MNRCISAVCYVYAAIAGFPIATASAQEFDRTVLPIAEPKRPT